jgi:hypothetical protein
MISCFRPRRFIEQFLLRIMEGVKIVFINVIIAKIQQNITYHIVVPRYTHGDVLFINLSL